MDKNTRFQIGPFAPNIWQIAFGLVMVLYSIIILITFQNYGITSDETHHVKYGADIVRWYTSGFQDRALFKTDNTYLYGGFFDTIAYLFSQLVPLDRYDANHLCNAFFGLLGILAAYRIGTHIGGSSFGFFCALSLLFTPRYYGHAFNNPKDIPFAVCYLWSLYGILLTMRAFPKISSGLLIKTGIAIGLTLGIRVGGILLWAYLAACWGWQYLQNRKTGTPVSFQRIALYYMSVIALSYGVMLIFWPWALTHPISAIPEALQIFSSFPEIHYSFFAGQYLGSNEIPWHYALTWLALTLPEFVLIGVPLTLFVCYRQRQQLHPIILLLVAAFFPIGYAIFTHTPLYDELRHMLFAIPPLVIISAFGMYHAIQYLQPKWQKAAYVITGICMSLTVWEMIQLHPYQYLYFNKLMAGGIEQASQKYETDYWESSYKAGVKWIDAHITFPQNERKLYVSSAYDNVAYVLNKNRFEFVKPPQPADIYLGNTRFDRHRLMPGEIIHTIHAKTVPLLYIIRIDPSYQHDPFFSQSAFRHIDLAEQYTQQENREAALQSYQKALQLMPGKNQKTGQIGQLYIKMGNLFFDDKNYREAAIYYQKAIDYDSDNAQNCAIAYNNIGLMYAHQSQLTNAIPYYQKALEKWPNYSKAHENIGDIYVRQQQLDAAISAYLLAIDADRNAGKVYSKLAEMYTRKNDFHKAIAAFKKLIQNYPDEALNHYNLALLYHETQQNDAALESYQQAIRLSPNFFEPHHMMGKLLMQLKKYPEAIESLLKARQINNRDADVCNDLGVSYIHTDQAEKALSAFEQALQLNPAHSDALKNLTVFKEAISP